jgi:hypothetical protein
MLGKSSCVVALTCIHTQRHRRSSSQIPLIIAVHQRTVAANAPLADAAHRQICGGFAAVVGAPEPGEHGLVPRQDHDDKKEVHAVTLKSKDWA